MNTSRIIISSYDDIKNPYYGGGGAFSIREIFSRLTNDFDITVITSRYPNSKNETIERIKYQRIGVPFLGPFKIGQIIFQLFLPFYVLTKKYDIWIESFTPPFSTNFLQLFTQRPVIGLVHMLSAEDMKRKYKLNFEFIEKLGLKTYKYIITMSDNVKQKILSVNPKVDIKVIPNGVSIPLKRFAVKSNKYILYLGRVEINQKGIDLLLEAYAKVAGVIKQKLYIAGSGEDSEVTKLRELIKFYNLEKRVVYLGKVEGDKKERFLAESSFVVMPSRFETFPLVSLEAMSYSKPIVCFDINGLSWIPKKVAIKVKPFNTVLLSEAIKKLAENRSVNKRFGKNGILFAKNYSWNKFSNEYKSYLNKILIK